MQWTDDAVVLSSLKFGENSLILDLLTKSHGRCSGMVRSGKKSTASYQTGNIISVTWRGRLEEHLGTFSVELKKCVFPLFMDSKLHLSALSSACELIKSTLPEREPYPEIFDLLCNLINKMEEDDNWLQFYVELEMELLCKLGFGLDLMECAATGTKNGLFYVSPKSGRAVSEESGAPYKEKLLPLPDFLRPEHDNTYNKKASCIREIVDGTKLTLYFLEKYVFAPRNYRIPAARGIFVKKLQETSL